jgi:hypothetical protein
MYDSSLTPSVRTLLLHTVSHVGLIPNRTYDNNIEKPYITERKIRLLWFILIKNNLRRSSKLLFCISFINQKYECSVTSCHRFLSHLLYLDLTFSLVSEIASVIFVIMSIDIWKYRYFVFQNNLKIDFVCVWLIDYCNIWNLNEYRVVVSQ